MRKYLVLLLAVVLVFGMAVPAMAADLIPQIKIGIDNDQGMLTPYTDAPFKDYQLLGLVYDCLYELDTNRVPQPCLATSYEISADYSTYTFHLRDDVKWHDGVPFTAEDVKTSYELVADKIYDVNWTYHCQDIAQINIPDPYTVEFVFKNPKSEEIITTLFAYMPVAPKHIYENLTGDEIVSADLRIGSGPYMIADLKEGNYYTLKANKDYFGGMPVAEELVLIVLNEPTAAFTAIQSKQIDVLMRVLNPELVDQFKADNSLGVVESLGFRSCLLYMNEYRYPFNEKDFRQAIASAVDVEDITNTVMLGNATVGSPGFVHPGYHLYNPATPKYVKDLDKANALLDGLGFADTNGDGIREDDKGKPLAFEILVYANAPTRIRAAEIIKEQLAVVGINITVNAMEADTADSLIAPNWDAIEPGEYDMAIWGWGDMFMSSPVRYVEQYHSDPAIGPSNIVRINDEQLDKLLENILYAVDLDERDKYVDEFQLLLAELNPQIVIWYQNIANAYVPTVYDQWQGTIGRTIVSKSSLVSVEGAQAAVETAPPAAAAQPAAPTNTPAPAPETKSPMLYILLGVVVVIVIVVVLTRKKK